MTIKKTTVFLSVLILVASVSYSQTEASAGVYPAAGESPEVSLVFTGPADPLYSWWGHVAIMIEDKKAGTAVYYDYGNFSFDQDNFIENFVQGRLYFLKMASNPSLQIRYSAFLNRDVTIYRLNLTEYQKKQLTVFLENEVKPGNNVYLYDHFYDNCSTRIRDVLDSVLDGGISAETAESAGNDLRTLLRYYTGGHPAVDWLLNFAMNGSVDREISIWDQMFLPAELEKYAATASIRNADGTIQPLVAEKKIYHQAEGRPPIPETPSSGWVFGLITGLAAALAAMLVRPRREKSPARLRLYASASIVFSLFTGFCGTLLFFMSFFTDHTVTYWNQNLLFMNPVSIATLVLSVRLAASAGKGNAEKALAAVRLMWRITAAGCAAAILLKAFPGIYQQNTASIIMTAPASLIMSGLLPWRSNIRR